MEEERADGAFMGAGDSLFSSLSKEPENADI